MFRERLKTITGPVEVITIAPHTARRANFQKNFGELDFRFFVGVDMTADFKEYEHVNDIPDHYFEKWELDKNYASIWSKGQLGCFATEKMILLKHRNSPTNVTIMLDDAVPIEGWEQQLINAYGSLPERWDALVLGTALGKETRRLVRPIVHLKRKIEKGNRGITRKYNKFLDQKQGSFFGIFGTIYSPNGIKKLFNEPKGLREDMDDILFSRLTTTNYLNVFISYPQIVREGKFDHFTTASNKF